VAGGVGGICRDGLAEELSRPLPTDNVNFQLVRWEDLRAAQYTEFFLIGGNPISGDLHANVYNTQDLNGYTAARL
jgi:hypothetical protein